MANITKTQDPSIPDGDRAVVFDSTTPDFVVNDVLLVQTSLGRSAARTEIACDADATITVRINAQQTRYPIHAGARLLNWHARDMSAGVDFINADAATVTVANGETLIIDDVPIANLQVTALTSGAGTGAVISAR